MSDTLTTDENRFSFGKHVADTSTAATHSAEYPRIAAEKYAAALERVANVHERFSRELQSISMELDHQTSQSGKAVEDVQLLEPYLNSIVENIRSIGETTRQSGTLVRDGREFLNTAVGDIQTVIGQIKQRNLEMQGILDIGQQVMERVDRIAEIAVENKLIAINASVTASKASDKVKGFKVIAGEVSKISGAMAERVNLVVQHAAWVGERMQQIMSNMDESIHSTQKAMGTIDQAFALLDGIATAIQEGDAANTRMLAENSKLARNGQTIVAALASIKTSIADIRRQADAVQATKEQQDINIRTLLDQLPDLDESSTKVGKVRLEPENSKHLRLAEAPLIQYDPAFSRMIREVHFLSFVCIRLLRYSSDKKLVPYLADSWFLHPDGQTWEFNLKKNVVFHDGSPVTTLDVKFSLERLMNPVLASPYANLFSVIEGAEAFMDRKAETVSGIMVLDDHVMQIRLKSSYNFFLSLLALCYSSIIKRNPAYFSVPLSRGMLMSAGPFRLLPSDGTTMDVLAANRQFLNGRPFLDSLEIRRDTDDALQELVEGKLDLVYNVTADSGAILSKKGFDGISRSYVSRYCYGLAVNFTRPNCLTRHRELRQALSMAMDKDTLIRDELNGKAIRADMLLSSEILDTGGRVFIKHDLAAARRIFESFRGQEDMDRPFKIAIRNYPTMPDIQRIAERLRSTFAALGLTATTTICPMNQSIDTFREEYDLIFLGFLAELDLYSAVEPFINPEGGDNYFGYHNPELYKLLEASISIKDNVERQSSFVKILEQLTLDVFMLPLFFQEVLCISSQRVQAVFISAEETVLPDAIYLSTEQGSRAAAHGSPDLATYDSIIDRLARQTAIVVDTSRNLVNASKAINSLLALQKDRIVEANTLFSEFVENATAVQSTREILVTTIRHTATEAGQSRHASEIIHRGLDELSTALHGTLRSLDQVRKDIMAMLSIVRDINESNDFINSVAINAAIIAAKSDAGNGDLRKVSQSIAEQAGRNTEYTNRVLAILDEMNASANGHHNFLSGAIAALDRSAAGVIRSGGILEKVGPLLDAGNQHSMSIGDTSIKLADVIEEARHTVDNINREASMLAVHASTLNFGLDLEMAVADNLNDVSLINSSIRNDLMG
jgi:ABC-type transport system substrate-binding protein